MWCLQGRAQARLGRLHVCDVLRGRGPEAREAAQHPSMWRWPAAVRSCSRCCSRGLLAGGCSWLTGGCCRTRASSKMAAVLRLLRWDALRLWRLLLLNLVAFRSAFCLILVLFLIVILHRGPLDSRIWLRIFSVQLLSSYGTCGSEGILPSARGLLLTNTCSSQCVVVNGIVLLGVISLVESQHPIGKFLVASGYDWRRCDKEGPKLVDVLHDPLADNVDPALCFLQFFSLREGDRSQNGQV
mmetsp:Transcript_135059/g.259558  ORF Transcript_135059/g.259558 Transcript_135059/m.259558 type:complete len:242 (+) Transcript_135059:379-1104(+)